MKNSFESQLTELCSLLDTNQPAEALHLLQTLTEKIESAAEYPFCPNPVINAVLSNKKQACLDCQIAFHTNIQIGSCDFVDKLHLCSIFSNLLDNALEANQKITSPADRYIDLTAKQSGDYLHIKVKNPSLPPLSLKKGHGYGQKILKDIAAKYAGTFRTHYKNHIYEAYICIQAPNLEFQHPRLEKSKYCKTLEEHHTELSKIRHDYNNHLAVLYALISSGKTEAAKELAASLKNQIFAF